MRFFILEGRFGPCWYEHQGLACIVVLSEDDAVRAAEGTHWIAAPLTADIIEEAKSEDWVFDLGEGIFLPPETMALRVKGGERYERD